MMTTAGDERSGRSPPRADDGGAPASPSAPSSPIRRSSRAGAISSSIDASCQTEPLPQLPPLRRLHPAGPPRSQSPVTAAGAAGRRGARGAAAAFDGGVAGGGGGGGVDHEGVDHGDGESLEELEDLVAARHATLVRKGVLPASRSSPSPSPSANARPPWNDRVVIESPAQARPRRRAHHQRQNSLDAESIVFESPLPRPSGSGTRGGAVCGTRATATRQRGEQQQQQQQQQRGGGSPGAGDAAAAGGRRSRDGERPSSRGSDGGGGGSRRRGGAFYLTLVPIRPRSRGERRSLRTLPGVSLRPPLGFNPDTPRRLSTPPDAFELNPDA
jgi:hypothetical protein